MKMARRLATLAALLLSAFAAADDQGMGPANGGISRGNFLRIPDYRTPGTATTDTYFVDGSTGNNNFNCQVSTTPCATIQGALNKVPKLLRNQVTISVAAGNYACFYISGFTTDNGFQQTTGGLLIDGSLSNFAPATGTATGTATGGTAGTLPGFGTLTDSGQTWTVNNLRGKFIVITGGTGSGQVRAISSNTATAITIVGIWTAPVAASSTYAIQQNAVNINTACSNPASPISAAAANASAIYAIDNNVGYRVSAIVVRNIGVTSASGSAFTITDSSGYAFIQSIYTGASSPIVLTSNSASRNNFDTIVDASSTAGTYLMSSSGPANTTIIRSMSYNGNSGLLTVSTSGSPGQFVTVNQSEAVAASATNGAAVAIGNGRVLVLNSRLDCVSGGSTTAISAGIDGFISGPNQGIGPVAVTVTTVFFGGTCGVGMLATALGRIATGALTGSAATTGYRADWGGQIELVSGTQITGGTQDYMLDSGANGAPTGSIASLTAGFCARTLSYNSAICNN